MLAKFLKKLKDKVEENSQKVEPEDGRNGKDKISKSVHFVQHLNNKSLERAEKTRKFSRIRREFLD